MRRLGPASQQSAAEPQDGRTQPEQGNVRNIPNIAARQSKPRSAPPSNTLPGDSKNGAVDPTSKPQARLPIDDLTREFMSRQLRINQEMRAAGLKRQGRDKRPGHATDGHDHHHHHDHSHDGHHDHSHDHHTGGQAGRSEEEAAQDGLGGGSYQVPETSEDTLAVPEVPVANSFDPSAPRSELQFDDLHPGIRELASTDEINGSDLTSYAAEAANNGDPVVALSDEELGANNDPESFGAADEQGDQQRLDVQQGTAGQKKKGYPPAKPSKGYPPAKPGYPEAGEDQVKP